MKIKVSDWIVNFLLSKNIDTIFSVTGGMSAHLLDSIAKNPDLIYINNRHEQACAMSADGYFRIAKKPAAVLVTNGPGSSNTITGVVGAFQDSIPMIVISGQCPIDQTVNKSNLRQLGVQELDIIPIVKSFTKFSVQVREPKEIKKIFEEAYFYSTSGRMGPVWIDIPLDIQSSFVEKDELTGFNPKKEENHFNIDDVIKILSKSKKPLIVAGSGIHLSNSELIFLDLVKKFQIPTICTWAAKDLFHSEDPLFIGNFGLFGERGANIAVQNADLLLILGSRLSIPNIGYNYKNFSPNSTKIMVDIDGEELDKKTLKIDHKINIDLNLFINSLLSRSCNLNIDEWKNQTKEWKKRYPIFLPEYRKEKSGINSFYFTEVLSNLLNNDIIVTDMGTSFTCVHQSLQTNGRNRLFTSSGTCSMGFGLPGAIGAWVADNSKNIIMIAGDGGFQMNIQELQTIIQYSIPIKIFILNNNGYSAISLMQDNLFNSNYIGSTAKTGVSAPNFSKIGRSYGIKSIQIKNSKNLKKKIKQILSLKQPVICEIFIPENQPLFPRVQSYKDKNGQIISGVLEKMFHPLQN